MRTALVTVTMCVLAASAQAKYSGGTGEPNDPYQIATASDLIALGGTPEDYDNHFILTADIDLDPNLSGGRLFTRAVIAPETNPMEPGFQGTPFTGVFDGNGHSISHLTVDAGDYAALFGRLETGAEVKNLAVVNVSIAGSGFYAGGIVGWNGGGSIATSYSSGTIRGHWWVGGIAGGSGGAIATSYSTVAVAGTGGAGGLLGENWGSVIYCYSSGSVKCLGSWVGGLVGADAAQLDASRGVEGIVRHCFWDIETSGRALSAGGTGKTTAEMQTASTYSAWGTCENMGTWTLDEHRDYPRLWWENQPGEIIGLPSLSDLLTGSGIQDDPFLIYTPDELNMVGLYPCEFAKHFRLMADIDLRGLDGKEGRPFFNCIGSCDTPFIGAFDGNGHTISHLTINGQSYVGLFGRVGAGAQVKNLGIVSVDISGSGKYVGALGGCSGGSVSACYSTGSVSGTEHVGGLVGRNDSGSIISSFSNASVSGTDIVGGLAGGNYGGSIGSSYSSGSVTGGSSVGGLVGYSHKGSIAASYSRACVTSRSYGGGLVGRSYYGSVSSSFWDVETAWQVTSSDSTGKTTAEMQDIQTFLSAGWDFVDEAGNGTCEYWQISPGEYPQLCCCGVNRPVMREGLGTPEQPYLIRDARDLGSIWLEPLAHYRLAQSIDLSGMVWSLPVIPWFGGVFDANDHVISNLRIQGAGHLGLFGQLSSAASVSNLGLEAAEVVGNHNCVGALVGMNHGTITATHSSGSVKGAGYSTGGLAGYNGGSIVASHSSVMVNGTGPQIGGLAGSNDGTIAASHSGASVSGTGPQVGGLVGSNTGSITGSYSAAAVSVTYSQTKGTGWAPSYADPAPQKEVGGLVGNNRGTIGASYSTGSISGTSRVGGLVGRNYGNITASHSTGSVSATYNVGGLVGSSESGSITACYSSGSVTATGQYSSVGGLVGYNGGSIISSFSNASISGTDKVGGLVGSSESGSITNCYSKGSVNASGSQIGGLVGWNSKGLITNCYSTVFVKAGGSQKGGLVGYRDKDSVVSSFYDNQTSGQPTSWVTSKTTAEMQMASTFLKAGWDFVGETANGTEDIWWIDEGKDYPRLWWEDHD